MKIKLCIDFLAKALSSSFRFPNNQNHISNKRKLNIPFKFGSHQISLISSEKKNSSSDHNSTLTE